MTTELTASVAYERLGRYEMMGEIASGGMATVYLGRVTGAKGFQRLVAIKRLHPHLETEEDFVSMFLDEARLAARIRHPNCVATLDVEDQEGLYIVMEYIEGDRLLGLLRHANKSGERIPPAVALRIALDTLAGLHAAHELCDDDGQLFGLVHRDVSPQNILIGVDGVARLTDFGIAKATARLTVTRDGQLKGKIAYMAPEQTKKVEIDRRVDVFAMGIITWEMLTSKKLFTGDSDVEVLNQLLFEPIPRLKDSAPGVPASLDAAVMKALERDPNKRYATALEFSEALEAASKAFGGPANARTVAAHLQKTSGEKLAKDKARFAAGANAHTQSDTNTPSGPGSTSKVQRRPTGAHKTVLGTGPRDVAPEEEVILAGAGPGPGRRPDFTKKTLVGTGSSPMLAPSAAKAIPASGPPSYSGGPSSGVGIVPDLDDEEEIPTAAFAKERKDDSGLVAADDLEEAADADLMVPAPAPSVPMSSTVPGIPVLPKVPAPMASPLMTEPAVPAPPVFSMGGPAAVRSGVKTEVLGAMSPLQAGQVLRADTSVPSATGFAAVGAAMPEEARANNSRAGLMVGVGGALLAAGGLAAVLLLRSPARDPAPQVRVLGSSVPTASAVVVIPVVTAAPTASAVPVEASAAVPTTAPTAAEVVQPSAVASAVGSAIAVAPTAPAPPVVTAAPSATAAAPVVRPTAQAANANARVVRPSAAPTARPAATSSGPIAAPTAAAPTAAPRPTATAAPRPTAAPNNDPFGDDNPYH